MLVRKGLLVEIKGLIRQISEKEPLNPFQIDGMTAVIQQSGTTISDESKLVVDRLSQVLMILDRAGREASPYLIDLKQTDSKITLTPRFSPERLGRLEILTSFEGRRQAIRENLVPLLYEIPNWLDLVKSFSHYSTDLDEESIGEDLSEVMEVILGYFFAATRQPFDSEARSEGEYALFRLTEAILKTISDESFPRYLPYVRTILDFMTTNLLSSPLNSFERRIVEAFGLRSALKRRSDEIRESLWPSVDRIAAQVLITALAEIRPCPEALVEQLAKAFESEDPQQRQRFQSDILERIHCCSEEGIAERSQAFQRILDQGLQADETDIRETIQFIRGLGEDWKEILASFEEMIDSLPLSVHKTFAHVLAHQILAIDKPDVKALLIDGLCRLVVRLEETRKSSSRELIHTFVNLFMDRAFSSADVSEKISSLKAVESLGVTLGRRGYFLMAQELLDDLLKRPLIRPPEKKYTIEDDDTGEPLVLAEEMEGIQTHVQHIKSLMAIVSSSPRIMRRLVPYLTVQLEMGTVHLCDEDLIQYSISRLIRADSSITHFLIRTLIKAIPYSFKDIGPLDTLRLTAAGLAKELSDRGVKPIGNFLGKLRGDIHWRGSIENFFFCLGIVKYFANGDPESMAEWMPPESMPYLTMDQWCSESEAQGIRDLCLRIFQDLDMDPLEKDGLMALTAVNTSAYRDDPTVSEFAGRIVTEVIDLLRGLHSKYFILRRSLSGTTVSQDLDRLERIISERGEIKRRFLVPDISDPVAPPVTLTEGSTDYVEEIQRIKRDQPGTPIVLRAKKAGHAYAQKATYTEEGFEAFNKDLALESQQETLATTISNSHLEQITEDKLPLSLRFIDDLVKGLAVNGHSSYYLEQAGQDLRNAGSLALTFDKVRDLLMIIKKELDDVHDLYTGQFEEPFDKCFSAGPVERLPRKLRDLTTLKEIPETEFFKNYLKTLYISDLQARDGNLRVLETFLEKVELFLNRRLADSGRVVVHSSGRIAPRTPFYFAGDEELSSCKIGLKASLLRFAENTPPYFVITTDQPTGDKELMLEDDDFREGLSKGVKRLEESWGKGFGDPSNPMLLSIRSGSRISMPGMMTTVTNVGINDEMAAALAKAENLWFAYDCYRRFLQEFSQCAFGVAREEFQDIMDERKIRWRVMQKAEMSGEQMRQLAFDYKRRVSELAPKAIEMLDEGRFTDILIYSAVVVSHSFEGRAARQYRQAAGIDGNWGTPVIVQAMAYGNIEFESSGTGVVAYDPFSMSLRGDFSLADQGTDVVGGKVGTIPVYDLLNRQESMATKVPAGWKQLSPILFRTAERLHFDASLEYTVEKGKVFVLQIRKQRDKPEPLPSLQASGYKVIAQGTGVSGKIFRGIVVTDRGQIAPYRHIAKAQAIIDAMNRDLTENEKLDGFIFVVNDPIPEEVMEEVFSLPVATALVSRLGGRGAHVSDIAKSLGKVYVGQVRHILKFTGKPSSVHFKDLEVVVGNKMIVHGQTGEIALYDRAPAEQSSGE